MPGACLAVSLAVSPAGVAPGASRGPAATAPGSGYADPDGKMRFLPSSDPRAGAERRGRVQ